MPDPIAVILTPAFTARRGVRALGAALLAAASLAAWGCDSLEGTTPECTQNVDKNGIHLDEKGCSQFAICKDDPENPATCCKGLEDLDLDNCLYGYGIHPAATGGTGGAGGTGGGTGGTGGAGGSGGSP